MTGPATTSGARYHFGFVMDQVAGHVTNYKNLRTVTDLDPQIDARWCEVHYFIPGGSLERAHQRLFPFVPGFVVGNARGAIEFTRGTRGRRFDAVFCNAAVTKYFPGTVRRTPTILDFDSTPVQLDSMAAYALRPDPWPFSRIKGTLAHRVLHAGAVLHAWSNWAKQSAIDDYGVPADKIVVNPPGVDLGVWRPGATTHQSKTTLRVLFVGGDFHRKGGHLLLDWYRHQRPEDVELHLVTREPLTPMPGIFVYPSMQPNSPELIRLYHEADLFVLPSLAECFGIATVEAMATGLPVVVSDSGGSADIVEHGGNGRVVRAGDADDLAATLDSLLADPAARARMGTEGRRRAEARFDVTRNAQRTLDLLKGLADDARERAAFSRARRAS